MLPLDQVLAPNTDAVAAEVIDGEAIIINLANGIYYSTDGVGALVWGVLTEEASLDGIVEAVIARYDVSPDQARVDVERLVRELLEQNLISISENHAGVTEPASSPTSAANLKLPYRAPELNVYSDMADLLALDPPMPGFTERAWGEPAAGA